MKLIKRVLVIEIGNGAAVYVPREYSGRQVPGNYYSAPKTAEASLPSRVSEPRPPECAVY